MFHSARRNKLLRFLHKKVKDIEATPDPTYEDHIRYEQALELLFEASETHAPARHLYRLIKLEFETGHVYYFTAWRGLRQGAGKSLAVDEELRLLVQKMPELHDIPFTWEIVKKLRGHTKDEAERVLKTELKDQYPLYEKGLLLNFL